MRADESNASGPLNPFLKLILPYHPNSVKKLAPEPALNSRRWLRSAVRVKPLD